MYVRRRIRPGLIWKFSWRSVLGFGAWSTLVTGAEFWFAQSGHSVGLPYAPLGTIGVAVAFYIGFKNAQSYDRLWEGRRIWGGIVNTSRSFANEVLCYVVPAEASAEETHAAHRRILYRQLAWVHALRAQLRRTTIFDRENLSHIPDLKLTPTCPGADLVQAFLPKTEVDEVFSFANPAAQILRKQAQDLTQLCRSAGAMDSYRHVALMGLIRELIDLQGRCERIKATPFPRQYAYFSAVFVWIFVMLLPFGLVHELSRAHTWSLWLTIPLSILISWVFTTIEVVGDNSEDPFENYIYDVPMSAICRTIEIDLRQSLGERDVPTPLKPVNDVLL